MQNRIEKLRQGKGWSQDDLADKANDVMMLFPHLKKETARNPDGLTSQKTIQKLEKGHTSLDERWLEILSIAFDVTPDAILGFSGTKGKEGRVSYFLEEMEDNFKNDPFASDLLKALSNHIERKKK